MLIREKQEQQEHEILSPYASFSDQSRGRDREEEQCGIGSFTVRRFVV